MPPDAAGRAPESQATAPVARSVTTMRCALTEVPRGQVAAAAAPSPTPAAQFTAKEKRGSAMPMLCGFGRYSTRKSDGVGRGAAVATNCAAEAPYPSNTANMLVN